MNKYNILILISLVLFSGCTYQYKKQDADNCEEIYNKLVRVNQTKNLYYKMERGQCIIYVKYGPNNIYRNFIEIDLTQYSYIKRQVEK
jgi:hypothetical protein